MFKHGYFITALQKVFFLLMLMFLFNNTEAQKRYGIMAGAGKTSLYRFSFSVDDYNKYSSITSYWGGLTADFAFANNKLNLFTSAVYNKRGYEYAVQNETGAIGTVKDSSYTQNLKYVDINITLKKKKLS